VDLNVDTAEHRRMAAEDLDEADVDYNDREESFDEHFSRLRAGFRTLQITGQVLKNFPGSIKAESKKDLTVECYSLGLRIMGWLLGELRDRQTELIEFVTDWMMREHPHIEHSTALRTAKKTVTGLTHTVAYGFIRRIAASVGSPELKKTYESVRKELDTRAVDLVHVAIKLDQLAEFPQKEVIALHKKLQGKPVPRGVLRALVANHFYMFPVTGQVKQRICDTLGIPYKMVQKRELKGKLLAKKRP
jgi:hypothetical protein